MNPPMPPDPAHDDALPDEAALKASYARLSRAEPAPALDAAIRRAAGEATRTGRRSPRRWPIALGTAATLVLAVGLAWRMRAPAPDVVTAAAPATDIAQSGTGSARESRPSAAPVGGAPASTTTIATREPATPTRTAMPAEQRPSRTAAADEVHLSSMRRMTPASADAMQAPRAPAPPPPPAPPAPPAPPSATAAAPVMAPSAARAAASAPAPFAAAAPAAGRAGDGATTVGGTSADDAAREFALIRKLYDRGERDAARRRLEAFRRSHPGWPLPDDLKRQLDDAP